MTARRPRADATALALFAAVLAWGLVAPAGGHLAGGAAALAAYLLTIFTA